MSTPQQGLEIISPATDQPARGNINIDIVAVPGLGADPSKSFGSEKPGGFNWLKDEQDGIRSNIPGARVMLYHYESRWLGADAKQQTLYNVASLLLDSLVEKRKEEEAGEPTRPLVFLAHSMGGLVVAKALTLAAAQPEKIEYMRIFECFAGAIFFGTPFKGSSAQSRALLLATFLEKVGGAIPTQMVQILDPERDSLDELRRDFVNLAFKEPRSNIACLYEQAKTNYLKEKVSQWVPKNHFKLGPEEIVVTQDSATLDGAVVRGLACNHRQLNRFDNAKDGRYEIVCHHLKEIVKNSQLVVKARLRASRQSVVDDSTFLRLSESLNVVEFQRKLRSAENLSGDSSWILEEPKYLQWATQANAAQPPEHPCLWVSGDEGLGKTKAAAAVVDRLKKLEAENRVPGAKDIMVAYFFCDPSPDCSVAENVLKSLIWQLILQRRSLAQYVKTFASRAPSKSRGGSSEGQFSLSKLWKGLSEMLQDPSVHEVYFVVANIHFLSPDQPGTAALLDAITDTLQVEPGSVEDPVREKARWVFLGRDRSNIRHVLQEDDMSGTLRIDLNDTSKSYLRRQHLRSFTQGKVKELADIKNYSLALQYFVFSSLEKRAESSTLWVDVVCSLLKELPANYVNVRKTLGLLPQDVGELLNRAWVEELEQPDKESIETTKEILRTLVIAFEDPTLQELSVLAELGYDVDTDESEETENKILEHVRACGPLLRVYDMDTWNDTIGYRRVTRVAFVHPLARDALLKPELRKLIGLGGDEEEEKTEIEWQHGIVGLRCFTYMLARFGADDDDDAVALKRTGPVSTNQAEAEIDELFFEDEEDNEEGAEDDDVDSYALEYPLKNWLKHGYKATPDFVDTLDVKHRFWSINSSTRRRWWGNFAYKDGQGELKNLTALHVAAFFGLLPLVDSLLADGHITEIGQLDSWDNQPLHWAAAYGHLEVCERLLEKGAEINNGRNAKAWTPLHMAASEDRLEVMKMLLDHHGEAADINAVAAEEGTALTLALSWRQTNAAKLLLERGADPTLTAADSEPPVAVAVLKGYEDLVDELLAAGGSRNLTSLQYGSALAAAASTGNTRIVKTILDLDGNLASRQRALEEAAAGGYLPVVELILEESASLPLDKSLENAAFFGQEQIVKRLWSSRHHNGLSAEGVSNALYHATDAQQESVVEFLLRECGANPNAVGTEYGNALTASAYDGTVSILKMLVQHGANVNAPEGYALQIAAANGHIDIVRVLLDYGANVNGFSERFGDGTPLQAACVAGNIAIAQILLEHGAHPDYGTGTFYNPLTAAAYHGYGELLELLLERGANPNVFGGSDGTTPLINAAATLPAKYLIPLLQHQARIDQQDTDGDTALIYSAFIGDDDCVTTLLRHGAKVNLGGKLHGSALHAAASRGFEATVRLLLKNGADPTQQSGPYHTVIQAAAASGNSDCVKAILEHSRKIDLNVHGGDYYSAVHAAAVQEDDKCLRQLLERKAKMNVAPPANEKYSKMGTPLHEAAFARCNRNARLLLDAGADPNIVCGKYGTVLQAAALKADVALVARLLDSKATVGGWSGKYGSALVAAVARDNDDDEDIERHEILNLLLEQEGFEPNAYKAALEMALKLRRKEDFKLILESYKAKAKKDVKNFPNIKGMMAHFKKTQQRERQAASQHPREEDENSDFGEDVVDHYQDIDDVTDEESQQSDEEAQENSQEGRNEGAGSQQARSLGESTRGLPVQTRTGGYTEGWQQGPQQGSRGFGTREADGNQLDKPGSFASRDMAGGTGDYYTNTNRGFDGGNDESQFPGQEPHLEERRDMPQEEGEAVEAENDDIQGEEPAEQPEEEPEEQQEEEPEEQPEEEPEEQPEEEPEEEPEEQPEEEPEEQPEEEPEEEPEDAEEQEDGGDQEEEDNEEQGNDGEEEYDE
ncbi:ankyrin repeat-containing domain protein [Mariannaea sp. PMI_226]|nr:ankyrin repeat-containing domain protein [Mariannaea sp. PMI_226]